MIAAVGDEVTAAAGEAGALVAVLEEELGQAGQEMAELQVRTRWGRNLCKLSGKESKG